MNYKEALEFIGSVSWKGSKPGLSRTKELLDNLNNPQKNLKFIHIAGTNGKGSTAAYLSYILTEAGYKTGLFISPYIERFNERMQINNCPISDSELAEITAGIKPIAEGMKDKPTEFEINTAIGMEYFNRNFCDIVVLEAGMGGELDSTNAIDSPLCSVITAIDLDHTAILGDTVEKIADTKSKIIKPGSSAVLYKQSDSVTDIIKDRCAKVGAELYISRPEKIEKSGSDGFTQKFRTETLGEFETSLLGGYQAENLAVVFDTVNVLKEKGYKISNENVRSGVAKASLPGRFEIINRSPLFIVDGSHNPHGMRATVKTLKEVLRDKRVMVIFGVMADKDYSAMLDEIIPLAEEILAVSPGGRRALNAYKLSEVIRSKGASSRAFDLIEDAVSYAVKKTSERNKIGAVCALGSLYMISDIKKALKKVDI